MRIGKIASSAEYRMDKQFQNLLIFRISIIFEIVKILKINNFSSCKILEICYFTNFVNRKNCQSEKFQKFTNQNIPKVPIID